MKTLLFTAVLLATTLWSVAAKPTSTGPDPDALLRELYRAHDAQKGPFFNRENSATMRQFLTKELADLIAKDTKDSQGEVGALEFDPLYESQDPVITALKVGPVNWGGIVKREGDEPEDGLAVVEVTFKDSGKPRRLTYRLHQDAKKAWKIADINYSDGRSIVGILRGDGAGPNGGNAAEPE